jgi:hypothetical protein
MNYYNIIILQPIKSTQNQYSNFFLKAYTHSPSPIVWDFKCLTLEMQAAAPHLLSR